MTNRKTVNLDGDVKAWLDNQDNASAVANRALKAWMESGDGKRGMIELRLRQVRAELEEARGRVERLEREEARLVEELEQLESQAAKEKQERINEAASHVQLRKLPGGEVEPMYRDRWETICENYDVTFEELLAVKKEENNA